jgi:hypothetical protein
MKKTKNSENLINCCLTNNIIETIGKEEILNKLKKFHCKEIKDSCGITNIACFGVDPPTGRGGQGGTVVGRRGRQREAREIERDRGESQSDE